MLYEAATGEPAFDDDESWTDASDTAEGAAVTPRTWSTGEQLAAGYPQLDGPAPSAAAGSVPAALAEAIDACLATEPDDRPSLDEVMERLRPLTA